MFNFNLRFLLSRARGLSSTTLCHRRRRQPSRCLCSVSVWSRTSSDNPIQTSSSGVLTVRLLMLTVQLWSSSATRDWLIDWLIDATSPPSPMRSMKWYNGHGSLVLMGHERWPISISDLLYSTVQPCEHTESRPASWTTLVLWRPIPPCISLFTSARRYCDASCLFVGWLVRLFLDVSVCPVTCHWSLKLQAASYLSSPWRSLQGQTMGQSV